MVIVTVRVTVRDGGLAAVGPTLGLREARRAPRRKYMCIIIILYMIYISLLESENAVSFKIPSCQTPVGLGTFSMSGRALHRQPGVGSLQPQEKVPRPAGVRHLYTWNL